MVKKKGSREINPADAHRHERAAVPPGPLLLDTLAPATLAAWQCRPSQRIHVSALQEGGACQGDCAQQEGAAAEPRGAQAEARPAPPWQCLGRRASCRAQLGRRGSE